MLLASREHLSEEKQSAGNDGSESSDTKSRSQVDPIQVSSTSMAMVKHLISMKLLIMDLYCLYILCSLHSIISLIFSTT